MGKLIQNKHDYYFTCTCGGKPEYVGFVCRIVFIRSEWVWKCFDCGANNYGSKKRFTVKSTVDNIKKKRRKDKMAKLKVKDLLAEVQEEIKQDKIHEKKALLKEWLLEMEEAERAIIRMKKNLKKLLKKPVV